MHTNKPVKYKLNNVILYFHFNIIIYHEIYARMITILGSSSLKFYMHVKFRLLLGCHLSQPCHFCCSYSDATINNCIMRCSSPSLLEQNVLSLEPNINLPRSERPPDFYCNCRGERGGSAKWVVPKSGKCECLYVLHAA
jgi:hypothetical protein